MGPTTNTVASRPPRRSFPSNRRGSSTLPSPTSAGGAMDAERIYVPLQTRRADRARPGHRRRGLGPRHRERVAAGRSRRHRLSCRQRRAACARCDRPATRSGACRSTVRWRRRSSSIPGGCLRWTRRATSWRSVPRTGSDCGATSLGAAARSRAVAGDNDAIYLTVSDGRVDLAQPASMDPARWEQQLPGMLSEPAEADGRVFVGSTDNFFYALDARNGSVRWKWRSGGDVIGAAAADDLVFITSLDNIIRAREPRERQSAVAEGCSVAARDAAAGRWRDGARRRD